MFFFIFFGLLMLTIITIGLYPTLNKKIKEGNKIETFLGDAHKLLQLDLGFGDIITPKELATVKSIILRLTIFLY